MNEEQLLAVLSCIGDGVITVDLQSRITFMNQAAEEITGWISANACGKPFDEVMKLVNADTQYEVNNPLKLAAKSGKVVGLPKNSAILSGQKLKYISASFAPILQRSKASGVVVVLREITQIKKEEKALLIERDNLKIVFEASSRGKVIIDQRLRIRKINETLLKEIDRGGPEIIGKYFGDVTKCPYSIACECHKEPYYDKCLLASYVKKVFETDEAYIGINYSCCVGTEDNRTNLWRKYDFVPIELDHEPCVMVIMEDITEQKRYEETLVRANDFYMRMFENFPAYILRTDIQGNVIYMSDNWIRLIGNFIEGTIDKDWMVYLHPDDKEEFYRLSRIAYEKRKPYECIVRIMSSTGEYRWIHIFNRPVYDMDNMVDGFIGMALDIHDKKRIEDELTNSESRYRSLFMKCMPDLLIIRRFMTKMENFAIFSISLPMMLTEKCS